MRLWSFGITGVPSSPFSMLGVLGMSLWRNSHPSERHYNATCSGTTAGLQNSLLSRDKLWFTQTSTSRDGSLHRRSLTKEYKKWVMVPQTESSVLKSGQKNHPGDVVLGKRYINVCWTMKDMYEAFLEFPNRYTPGKVGKRKALLILNPRDASVSATMYVCRRECSENFERNFGGTV